MTFDPAALAAFKADALARWPHEACGLLTAAGYVPCRNIAADPLIDFRLPEVDFVAHGPVAAVLHSHTHHRNAKGAVVLGGLDWPSLADQISQAATSVPWGISVVTASADGAADHVTDPFFFGDGLEPLDLVGRPFRHAVTDCYALVRDWWLTQGIALPNFPRDETWWLSGGDLYRDHFAEVGFAPIDPSEARAGDCFLAQIHSRVPNHAGVYLGDGLILHHAQGTLSRRDPLSRWQRHITHWLRHESRA